MKKILAFLAKISGFILFIERLVAQTVPAETLRTQVQTPGAV